MNLPGYLLLAFLVAGGGLACGFAARLTRLYRAGRVPKVLAVLGWAGAAITLVPSPVMAVTGDVPVSLIFAAYGIAATLMFLPAVIRWEALVAGLSTPRVTRTIPPPHLESNDDRKRPGRPQ